MSQWEGWHPIYEMDNKFHVWNHQPWYIPKYLPTVFLLVPCLFLNLAGHSPPSTRPEMVHLQLLAPKWSSLSNKCLLVKLPACFNTSHSWLANFPPFLPKSCSCCLNPAKSLFLLTKSTFLEVQSTVLLENAIHLLVKSTVLLVKYTKKRHSSKPYQVTSIWSTFRHSIWQPFGHSIWIYLTYTLTFYLASTLTSYLTVYCIWHVFVPRLPWSTRRKRVGGSCT